jgi:hypothetical protein
LGCLSPGEFRDQQVGCVFLGDRARRRDGRCDERCGLELPVLAIQRQGGRQDVMNRDDGRRAAGNDGHKNCREESGHGRFHAGPAF